MKEQKITIDIDGEGRVTADAEGFAGDACMKELERLLAALASGWEQVERKQPPQEAQLSTSRTHTVTTGSKSGGKP